MEQKAERLVKDDRTHYLQAIEDTGFVWPMIELMHTPSEVRITRWDHSPFDIQLSVTKSGFTFAGRMNPYEARLIARALLNAADDAEKAIDAAYDQDEVPA